MDATLRAPAWGYPAGRDGAEVADVGLAINAMTAPYRRNRRTAQTTTRLSLLFTGN